MSGNFDHIGARPVPSYVAPSIAMEPAAAGYQRGPCENYPPQRPDDYQRIPTTVVARYGDTVERLAYRYQIPMQQLRDMNPQIFFRGPDSYGRYRPIERPRVHPGEIIRLRPEMGYREDDMMARARAAQEAREAEARRRYEGYGRGDQPVYGVTRYPRDCRRDERRGDSRLSGGEVIAVVGLVAAVALLANKNSRR